jgi:undecaprenyl diphosphate synthase
MASDSQKIPTHVAIIMDGNGRWARKRGLPRAAGHKAGVSAVKRTVEAASELGLKYLTLYAFSTENWTRPEEEISGLMRLMLETIKTELDTFHDKGIRLKVIGRWRELAPEIVAEIEKAIEKTARNEKGTLVLALNYSGRAEITDAASAIAAGVAEGRIKPASINEDLLEKNLYAPDIPSPDLLIRTSGEMRVSNFLLWQIAYTELWITPDFWPDFGRAQLEAALNEFKSRRRRYGGLDEDD